MRLFIASFITNDEIKEAINFAQEKLLTVPGRFKNVNTRIIHFTYQFIGEVQPHVMENIKKTLSEINDLPEKFTINIKGIGVFPLRGTPRVIWAGVSDGAEQMKSLAAQIHQSLKKIGFKPDKPFKPHLTIARVKFVNNPEIFASWKKEFENMNFGNQLIDRFSLVQSILTRDGPIYKTVMDYELK